MSQPVSLSTVSSSEPPSNTAACTSSNSTLLLAQPDDTGGDDVVKHKPHLKPYGCGCGNCSLQAYLEGHCPNPVETTSKLPYLNTRGLRENERELLIGRLGAESTDMVFRFQGLVSTTCLSLCQQDISPLTLTTHLKSLGTLKHVHTSDAAYFRDRFQEIEDAQNIDKIFSITQEYMSFINPGIVEHLIEKLGTDHDKGELQKYQKELETYCRRRVVECPSEYAAPNDGARIVVKKDEQLEQFTLTELRNFQSKLSKILQLTEYTPLLCTVEEGCLQMIYHIPAFVAEKVFPLTRDQEAQLQSEGVLEFSCGNYHYPNR